MVFDSVSAALAMDGHGGYVWAAYIVTALVIAALLVVPSLRRRRLVVEISAANRRADAVAATSSRGDV